MLLSKAWPFYKNYEANDMLFLSLHVAVCSFRQNRSTAQFAIIHNLDFANTAKNDIIRNRM